MTIDVLGALMSGIREYDESHNITKAITVGLGGLIGGYLGLKFGGLPGAFIGGWGGEKLAGKGYDLVSNYLAKNSFSDIVKDIFTNIFGAFMGGGPLSFLNAEAIYDKITSFISNILNTIYDKFTSFISNILNTIYDKFTSFISGLFGNKQTASTGQYTPAPPNKNNPTDLISKLTQYKNLNLDIKELEKMHDFLMRELPVDDIEVCPHDDNDNCFCRKPKPGLILQAAEKLNIDLTKSYVIGDRWKDIEAGRSAGCKTLLIRTEYNKDYRAGYDFEINNLKQAVEIIKKLEKIKI
ncbi:MAG: HAD-IIIA family hydrolase [Minisyncoccia bacterium]